MTCEDVTCAQFPRACRRQPRAGRYVAARRSEATGAAVWSGCPVQRGVTRRDQARPSPGRRAAFPVAGPPVPLAEAVVRRPCVTLFPDFPVAMLPGSSEVGLTAKPADRTRRRSLVTQRDWLVAAPPPPGWPHPPTGRTPPWPPALPVLP